MFSDKVEYYHDRRRNPVLTTFMIAGVSSLLGKLTEVAKLESRLVALAPKVGGQDGGKFWLLLGTVGVSMAWGYSMNIGALGRIDNKVPLPYHTADGAPTKEQGIRYLNATRGYYNMLEHLPMVLLTSYVGSSVCERPATVGACLTLWSLSRAVYAHHYAYGGPHQRMFPFLVAIITQNVPLGLVILYLIRSFRKN